MKKIKNALEMKYKGDIAEAEANVWIYLKNPAGIGEHPEIIAAIETLYPEFKDVATRNAQKSGLGLIVKQYYTYIQRQYAIRSRVSRDRRRAAGQKVLGPPV